MWVASKTSKTIPAKVAILNNNDSFVRNLAALVESCGISCVHILDFGEYTVSGLSGFDAILISPGPGLPDDFPVLKEVILHWGSQIPILGICLGHQAIAEAYGASLMALPEPRHGKEVRLHFAADEPLFRGIPLCSVAGLYHSWAVSSRAFPDVLQVIASDSVEGIMGIRHRSFPVTGLQFHPESYITVSGKSLMMNWLEMCLPLDASGPVF